MGLSKTTDQVGQLVVFYILGRSSLSIGMVAMAIEIFDIGAPQGAIFETTQRRIVHASSADLRSIPKKSFELLAILSEISAENPQAGELFDKMNFIGSFRIYPDSGNRLGGALDLLQSGHLLHADHHMKAIRFLQPF
jgi:hypothetical protein